MFLYETFDGSLKTVLVLVTLKTLKTATKNPKYQDKYKMKERVSNCLFRWYAKMQLSSSVWFYSLFYWPET